MIDPALPQGRRPGKVPRLVATPGRVQVLFHGRVVADTERGRLLVEDGQPELLLVPLEDVRGDVLRPVQGSTWSPWRGRTNHFDVVAGARRARRAAWTCPDPASQLADLRGLVAFLPGKVELRGLEGRTAPLSHAK